MDLLSPAVAAMRTGQPRSFRVECRAPWGRRYPPVPGAGFHVVLQGGCWLIPPAGEPLALGVGDVVLLPRGRGHALADSPHTALLDLDDGHDFDDWPPERPVLLGPDTPADGATASPAVLICGMYRMDQSRPHPLVAALPEVLHLPARHHGLRTAVDLLGAELETRQHGADAMVPALLDILLLHILRAWYSTQPHGSPRTGWAAALHDTAVSAALDAIHRQPDAPWTVDALAGKAALSRAAFARRFTTTVGQPPLSYLTWWRMTRAARLLRESDLPLDAVSRLVGYSSQFAFSNAFKREYGIPPGRYRNDPPGRTRPPS
ncbi:AraC family transcriptional regulator [Phytohabitans flavus]|uniref:AraC family transcriptional regulator n=1 Tax=Phytohabitans flavus TaxID=1076124 RepID=A0A6F8XW05_9ACTN|nr:AraC family transcriptional regulator [Phytohabitans flavus]BCB78042.1 AraC family transcriptional regulator [Phytohabitans flavus]